MLLPVKYVGLNKWLKGHTALGLWINGQFRVQLDDMRHPWSHRWHVTNYKHWRVCN